MKSQVPAWPRERELGVRAIRSEVAVVRGMAELGLGDRSRFGSTSRRSGSGRGDRLVSRSPVRAHPYRPRIHSAPAGGSRFERERDRRESRRH